MEIGIGLDQSLRLGINDHRALVREAVRLGYTSAWTPSGLAFDAFQTCGLWNDASRGDVDGGIRTGISVVPAPLWSVPSLAAVAATTGLLTGGRMVLGIGSGGIYGADYRRTFGLPEYPVVARMKDYVVTLRRLLAGEMVEYEGKTLSLHGVQLGVRAAVPVYLGALGPQMMRLAGAAADGACLNWCSAEQVRESRATIESAARKAGRDPADVKLQEYIRICVDDDVDAARGALARAVMGYALARPGASREAGYRGHFARMGFGAVLDELEAKRDGGATPDAVADAFPDELLLAVGYFGRADGASMAFRALAEGLDTAVVRVVPARPSLESIRAVMQACAPA